MEDSARPFQYNPNIVKEFIETYECLPELWDAKHPHYLNKNNRNSALGVLLKVLQKANAEATKADVRKKINTLRSNYRRELKKIYMSKTCAKSDEDVYQPSSWTFYSLTFLDSGDADKDVSTAIVVSQDDTNAEQILRVEQLGEVEEIELGHGTHTHFKTEGGEPEEIYVSEEVTLQPSHHVEYIEEEYLDHEPEKPPPPPPIKRQRTQNDNVNVIVKNNQLLKRVCHYLSRSEDHSQSTVWCRKLEKLDPTQRFYAEKAINDILFEAALGRLQSNSITINGENTQNERS